MAVFLHQDTVQHQYWMSPAVSTWQRVAWHFSPLCTDINCFVRCIIEPELHQWNGCAKKDLYLQTLPKPWTLTVDIAACNIYLWETYCMELWLYGLQSAEQLHPVVWRVTAFPPGTTLWSQSPTHPAWSDIQISLLLFFLILFSIRDFLFNKCYVFIEFVAVSVSVFQQLVISH